MSKLREAESAHNMEKNRLKSIMRDAGGKYEDKFDMLEDAHFKSNKNSKAAVEFAKQGTKDEYALFKKANEDYSKFGDFNKTQKDFMPNFDYGKYENDLYNKYTNGLDSVGNKIGMIGASALGATAIGAGAIAGRIAAKKRKNKERR